MKRNLVNIPVMQPEKLANYATYSGLYGRGKEARKIPLDKIAVRENFNKRIDFGDIESLDMFMQNGGEIPPLDGDILKHDGTFVITDGERRYRAALLLKHRGIPGYEELHCFINLRTITDEERLAKQASKNNGKKFAPMEEAELFNELRVTYGRSNADIARITGNTFMHVSNQLRLAGITDEEKDLIRDGSVSSTAVLDMLKNGMAPGARLDAVKDAASGGGSGEEGGKKKLKIKDVAVMGDLKVGLDKDETPTTILKGLLIDLRMLNRLIGTDSKMSDITFKMENSILGLKTLLKGVLPSGDQQSESTVSPDEFDENGRDPMFVEAAKLIVKEQIGTTSLLQRKLKIGYNRAGRIVDQLEKANIVGPFMGSAPRAVLFADEDSLHEWFIADTLKNSIPIAKLKDSISTNHSKNDDEGPF